jgi:hypothetical protein
MILECGCPGDYPDWHQQDVDLSHHAAHVLPIPTFLHMPLSYDLYRQRQQGEIEQLELREIWPGFALTRTGFFRGRLIRLLENGESPSRHVTNLEGSLKLYGLLHEGGIGTIREPVRQQQMALLDKGRMPKELYLSYLTCPRCSEQRGGEKILLLRRWKDNPRLAAKVKK